MIKTISLKEYVSFKSLLKSNLKILIATICFSLSLLLGSFAASVCDDKSCFGIASYFSNYLKFIENCDFIDLFLNSYFHFSILILINMVLGLCVIGIFLNWFILFLFGFGTGAVSGYIFYAYSLKGLCFFLLILLPGLFLFSLELVLSFKDSFEYSLKLFKTANKKLVFSANLKNYFLKYIIYFVILMFMCLFNAFVIINFYSFFNF